MAGSTTSEKVGKEPHLQCSGRRWGWEEVQPIATNYYRMQQGVAMAVAAQVRVGGNFIQGVRARPIGVSS